MSYASGPTAAWSLEQRIRNLEGGDGQALRRRIGMALVVSQMLLEGAIKCGSAVALRYGRDTRFTLDVDAARVQSPVARAVPQRLRGVSGGRLGWVHGQAHPATAGRAFRLRNAAVRGEA